MKFPKLKNPLLCRIIVYSLFLYPLIFLILGLFLEDFYRISVAEWLVPIFLISMVVNLIYLIRNFPLFFATDVILSTLQSLKKVREWYETPINGSNRETASKKINKRITLLARECLPVDFQIKPDILRLFRYTPSVVYYSKIEKYYFIYSVDYLDEKLFNDIITSVRLNIKNLHQPFKPNFFTDKNRRKSPVAKCSAVIILTDSVSPYVIKSVQNSMQDKYYGCILPCVADLSHQRYYFDAMTEYYDSSLMAKPEVNFAVRMVEKVVFGGRLPLKNNDQFAQKSLPVLSEIEKEENGLDMSVWELLCFFKKEFKQVVKEENKLLKMLREKEVLMTDSSILFKIGERATSLSYLDDEEDPKKITVLINDTWSYPKTSKISLQDMKTIKDYVSEALVSKGYIFEFDTEHLKESYQKIFR